MATRAARVVAFYLPQFHPIPENDKWWGPGFTEWTNVVMARPLFEGHEQPRHPTALGYYDLRVPEVREKQAELARNHGIEAFCYWHYWFEGRRLLHRPFDEVLASGKPVFPFCLAWANESWSRQWLGQDQEPLIEQNYSAEDDVHHARWLARAFADPRYLHVSGRPLFVIYRPSDLPDPHRLLLTLRTECTRVGLPAPYVLGTTSHRDADYRRDGFDGTIDFEPRLGAVFTPTDVYGAGLKVSDYDQARRHMRGPERSYPTLPCVMVAWDNTPRRGLDGIVLTGATPARLAKAIRHALRRLAKIDLEERFLFVNAWNEWAEGNVLEPDAQHGVAYLEALDEATLHRSLPKHQRAGELV